MATARNRRLRAVNRRLSCEVIPYCIDDTKIALPFLWSSCRDAVLPSMNHPTTSRKYPHNYSRVTTHILQTLLNLTSSKRVDLLSELALLSRKAFWTNRNKQRPKKSSFRCRRKTEVSRENLLEGNEHTAPGLGIKPGLSGPQHQGNTATLPASSWR